jgi:transcriptional regulator with XRE-family HTH domain
MITLPEKLRILRLRRQLNQEQVADTLGICLRTYGDLERGKRAPSLSLLTKLAEFYQTDIAELLERG